MFKLNRIIRRYTTAARVRQALRKEAKVTRKAIMECQALLAGALGESWHRASGEAAAGMVLVRFAKDSHLEGLVNDRGWEMVLASVGDHSGIVMQISPRAMPDIRAWQSTRLDALLVKAA